MKLAAQAGPDLNAVPEESKRLEALGYDMISTNETQHDAFLPAALVAEHTKTPDIMTSIVVAFARTPMAIATVAHDLNSYSKGRFVLGLGSQIKAHITRRFNMPWSHPAARMKEYIQALHAIWDSWYDKKPLKFEGQFYQHTLMTPYFVPPDQQYGRPRITLAAVGELMTKVAAEVADGLICHAFTTERYVREVTKPLVEETLKRTGRKRDKFQLIGGSFIATGESKAEIEKGKADARRQIAFYGSTPAYKPVLDLHGWGDLQPELQRLTRENGWDKMGALITDDILDAFAIVGTPKEVVRELHKRYGDLFDVMSARLPGQDAATKSLLSELKAR